MRPFNRPLTNRRPSGCRQGTYRRRRLPNGDRPDTRATDNRAGRRSTDSEGVLPVIEGATSRQPLLSPAREGQPQRFWTLRISIHQLLTSETERLRGLHCREARRVRHHHTRSETGRAQVGERRAYLFASRSRSAEDHPLIPGGRSRRGGRLDHFVRSCRVREAGHGEESRRWRRPRRSWRRRSSTRLWRMLTRRRISKTRRMSCVWLSCRWRRCSSSPLSKERCRV